MMEAEVGLICHREPRNRQPLEVGKGKETGFPKRVQKE